TTLAEVKPGGTITVYCTNGGERVKLYTCDPRETQSHAIPPELIRGATDVFLVAAVESIATYTKKTERRHVHTAVYTGKQMQSPGIDVFHTRLTPEYKAVLFPSNPNTIEVFRLKAVVGEPAPQIDKLFASNPDLLK